MCLCLWLIYTWRDWCNEWKTEKGHDCTNMGKVKGLELWWQPYVASLTGGTYEISGRLIFVEQRVKDRSNPVLHLLLYKAEYKHSLKYSRNNASLSVNVKVAYSEGLESAVCFMTVVLFPAWHGVFTVITTSRPVLVYIQPPCSVDTRALLSGVKLLEREAAN